MDNRDLERGDEIREESSAAAFGNSAEERMAVDSRRSTPRRRHPRNRPRTRKFSSSAAGGGHAAYFSFVTLLIGLIQIKYQNKDDSPFETQLTRMSISLVAICIYGLAVVFEHNVRGNFSRIVANVILVMGLLSAVSLFSIFVPNWLGWILYSIWAIFSVVVMAWDWFLHIIQWLYQKTKNAVLKSVYKLPAVHSGVTC